MGGCYYLEEGQDTGAAAVVAEERGEKEALPYALMLESLGRVRGDGDVL